jgi:hypothetical protein
MPLLRAREPFDDPEWIFELKYDGFRALAFVNGGGTRLVSRRGLEYCRFDDLRSEISLDLNGREHVKTRARDHGKRGEMRPQEVSIAHETCLPRSRSARSKRGASE